MQWKEVCQFQAGLQRPCMLWPSLLEPCPDMQMTKHGLTCWNTKAMWSTALPTQPTQLRPSNQSPVNLALTLTMNEPAKARRTMQLSSAPIVGLQNCELYKYLLF